LSWLGGGAALVALLVMLPALRGPFIFDDVALISSNHYVHDLAHWREWLVRGLWDTNFDVAPDQHRTFWRPLVVASYALDWWWGSGSPLPFHLTNMLLHAANAALLCHVLSGWLGRRWPAFVGALLFALHPAQTEAAAWIAGRTDALALFGLLLATLGVRRARATAPSGIALQALGLTIAFTAKEMAVVFPVFVVIEAWTVTRAPLDGPNLGRILRTALPYVLLSVGFMLAHRALADGDRATTGPALLNQLALIFEAYGRYTALVCWPDDLTLGRALIRFEGSTPAVHTGFALLGGCTWAVVVALSYLWRNRAPAAALALAAYAGLLLPVSGVVWLNYAVLVSPRFLYIPLVALALGLGALAATSLGLRRSSHVVLAVALAALGLRSAVRAYDYADTDRFWRRELTENPHYTPAQEHFVSRELQARRPGSALALSGHFLKDSAAAGVPTRQRSTLLLKLLASALTLTRDVDRQSLEAIEHFALSVLAGSPSRLSLPAAGAEIDITQDERLIRQLGESARTLRIIAAEAAERLGDDETARREVALALTDCEDCWTLLSTSALILARSGDVAGGLELARRAVRLAPPGSLGGLVEMIEASQSWQARAVAAPSPVARAGFHVALGSYGRAYAAARPAFDDPPKEPAGVLSLAQLAYQAGDVATAERLLAGSFPAPLVEQTLLGLSRGARWRDQPRQEHEWLPELGP
jgi:hypothetical protein